MLTVYWIPRKNSGDSTPRMMVNGDRGVVEVGGVKIAGGIQYDIPENDANKNFIATMVAPYYSEMPKIEVAPERPKATVRKNDGKPSKVRSSRRS